MQRFESARRLFETKASIRLRDNLSTAEDFKGRGGGMVDAADLKSVSREGVWVRVPPSAPNL